MRVRNISKINIFGDDGVILPGEVGTMPDAIAKERINDGMVEKARIAKKKNEAGK